MGVLQDFERRLEGAVEGFFARTFRSSLQPVELAKAIQRYAEDSQHVTEDGVVIPNVYRFHLNARDIERLQSYGKALRKELSEVVAKTAAERGWVLRGPALVQIEQSEDVDAGMYELTGRVEHVEADDKDATPAPADKEPSGPSEPPSAALAVEIVEGGDTGSRMELAGTRLVAGRAASCDIVLSDPTVSREHAAFVQRDDEWWVVDLGSTNGTTVDGVRAAEQAIGPDSRVELGEAVLHVVET